MTMEDKAGINIKRDLLSHYLAALAYRTQKALKGAPEDYSDFRAQSGVRTPHEIVFHMTNVIGYARTFYLGGKWRPDKLPSFEDEVRRFHEILESMRDIIQTKDLPDKITYEQLLQGPFSDAMTHAGQLALLRRLHGKPVPPENFVYADINPDNVGPHQPAPDKPDKVWKEPED